MPTTVNGIGTHYYGNRNRQIRKGQCRSCGHYGDLASYDTRLWFVVIFIPIIPLGRKRILDECPRCRRHYVAKADEFAAASELNVSEGKEKYLSNPTPESALEAHARMLSFHQHTEADAFRQEALARFPRDAKLRTELASHLDQMGRYGEAVPLYREAHALEPDLPAARVGVAFARMNEGKLNEAHRLLDFLEEPGAGQHYSLAPLQTLATLYQQKNLHEEALEIFRHLLKEFPDAARNHDIRKMVRVSERKLGAYESLLPEREGSFLGVFNPWSREFSSGQKTAAFLALVGICVVAGMATYNESIRRNRTLHIVSGLPTAATIQVDNEAPIQVASQASLTLPEGLHRVAVSGPVTAQYDVPIESSYWSRWFSKPVWVVNVAGTAGLMEMQYHYAQNPTPPTWNSLVGQTVIARPHIDYPFVDPPNSMQVSNKNQTITKSGIIVLPAEPNQLLAHVNDPTQALTFLEAHLPNRLEDGLLFHEYEERIEAQKAFPRAEAFLKPGLERRPVEVNWHRTYANVLEQQGRVADLTTLYDGFIAKEPASAALLYLRSRFEGDNARRTELLTNARKADPKSPWPPYGLGYQAAIRGDWADAVRDLKTASELGVPVVMIRRMLVMSRLGNGEADALIAEGRAALQQQSFDFTALFSVVEPLIATGRGAVALQEFETWKTRNQAALSEGGAGALAAAEAVRMLILYGIGDFGQMEQAAASAPAAADPTGQLWKTSIALATGHPERLVEDPSLSPKEDRPWDALALSVAFHLAHDDAKSEEWLRKGCDRLKTRGVEEKIAAEMLQSTEKPDFEVVRSLSFDISHKLIFLCALAQQFPDLEPQCRELAGKLNVSRTPPYQLVIKVFPVEG